MGGLSAELKYILEYSDETLLNYILYLQKSKELMLQKDQVLQGVEIAMGLGKQAIGSVEGKIRDLPGLLDHFGIERIYSIRADIRKNPIRAYYDPNKKHISINLDSVRTTYHILQIYNLPYYRESTIYRMHVLHEIYHHMEEFLTGHADDVVRSKLGLQCNLSIFSDISAFSFVNSLLGGFPCQIIDLLWLCYFNEGQEKLLYELARDWNREQTRSTLCYDFKIK
jgi:hypothetical protein